MFGNAFKHPVGLDRETRLFNHVGSPECMQGVRKCEAIQVKL